MLIFLQFIVSALSIYLKGMLAGGLFIISFDPVHVTTETII